MNCDNCESLERDIEDLESEIDDLEGEIRELKWDLDEAKDEKRQAEYDASDLEDSLIEAQKLLGSYQEIKDVLVTLQDLGYVGSNTIVGPAHFIRTQLIRRDECITSIGVQHLESNVKRSMEYVKSAGLKFMTLLQRLKK